MTVMADYAQYSRPQRRPVGAPAGQTMTKPPQQFPPPQSSQHPISPTHYHSRTASSAIFSPSAPHPSGYGNVPTAGNMQQQQQQYISQQQQQQQYISHPTRRMTNSTISSTDSNPRTYPQQPALAPGAQALPYRNATSKSSNTNLRRSTSSRSQASSLGPSSYVALLRKQKATVWCDKTQNVDPRVTAQQKAAKQRAAREILAQSGRNSIALSGNTTVASSGGMLGGRKKLHNAKGTTGGGGGAGANLAAGVGVPMRLSASEVGDEEFDEDDSVYTGGAGGVHRRTNSGKSSLTGAGAANQNRLHAPRTNTRLSHGSGFSGVSANNKSGSSTGITPPGEHPPPNYFEHRDSMGSNGSEERREKEMGDVGEMKAPNAAELQDAKRSTKDELSRRGSVDERSATMRGAAGAMRLFVANPDADDSD